MLAVRDSPPPPTGYVTRKWEWKKKKHVWISTQALCSKSRLYGRQYVDNTAVRET